MFELFEAMEGKRSLARGIVDSIGGQGMVEFAVGNGDTLRQTVAVGDHGKATLQTIRLLDSSGLLGGLEAVGHRVVHGRARFSGPVLLDAGAGEAIEELTELAPLHNAPTLAAIRAVRDALEPRVQQVAAIDTAFDRRMPCAARLFALPRRLTEEGILRYGFHGRASVRTRRTGPYAGRRGSKAPQWKSEPCHTASLSTPPAHG